MLEHCLLLNRRRDDREDSPKTKQRKPEAIIEETLSVAGARDAIVTTSATEPESNNGVHTFRLGSVRE